MPTLFHPVDGAITYVKAYSTFRNNITEYCVALILLPIAQHSHWVSLQSLQFDFDRQGNVRAITLLYKDREEDIQKKVDETLNELYKLESSFGKGECSRFIYNKTDKSLKISFMPSDQVTSYALLLFEALKKLYHMQEQFAEELKVQLFNRDYLVKEYYRLVGHAYFTKEAKTSCVIL
jgi:hypothetical protein